MVILAALILISVLFTARWFLNLNEGELARAAKGSLVIGSGVATFLLIIGGRVPMVLTAALVIFAILSLLPSFLKHKISPQAEENPPPSGSWDEACQILGVSFNPTSSEVEKAYRRLIQKVHPDKGGSHYLAMQVNSAKELLMKKEL